MTLEEARENVGSEVVYRQCCNPRAEQGTITGVRGRWAFVRYGWEATSKATDPADLTLVNAEADR